jgi:hypothetical protein
MTSRKNECRSLSGQHVHRANHPTSMSNGLLSSEAMRHYDNCRGIHGAAKARSGVKKATVHLSRRLGKRVVRDEKEKL